MFSTMKLAYTNILQPNYFACIPWAHVWELVTSEKQTFSQGFSESLQYLGATYSQRVVMRVERPQLPEEGP